MSFDAPDWAKWVGMKHARLWQLITLAMGKDPDRIGHDKLKASLSPNDLVRWCTLRDQAVTHAGWFSSADLEIHAQPDDATSDLWEITTASFWPWANSRSLCTPPSRGDLHAAPNASMPPQARVQSALHPVPRQRAQESAILAIVRGLGHVPTALPKAPRGLPGVKAQTKGQAKCQHPALFQGRTFDKAWQHLRDTGQLRDSESEVYPKLG